MSKHTPGVWIARPDPNGRPGDYCIGLDDDCSPPDYVAVCNDRDARLIAAAPDLLKALRLCAAVCAGDTSDKNGLIQALEAARAAMQKAAA